MLIIRLLLKYEKNKFIFLAIFNILLAGCAVVKSGYIYVPSAPGVVAHKYPEGCPVPPDTIEFSVNKFVDGQIFGNMNLRIAIRPAFDQSIKDKSSYLTLNSSFYSSSSNPFLTYIFSGNGGYIEVIKDNKVERKIKYPDELIFKKGYNLGFGAISLGNDLPREFDLHLDVFSINGINFSSKIMHVKRQRYAERSLVFNC